jgi:glutamate--cysteine ligase
MESEKLTAEKVREYVAKELITPKPNSNSQDCPGLIGVELEAFGTKVDKITSEISPLQLIDDSSFRSSLISLCENSGGKVHFYSPVSKIISSPLVDKVTFENGDSFQFEPGGQIEIATAPFSSFETLRSSLEEKQKILDKISAENDIHLSQFGTNPWFNAKQIGLQLDKPRYIALQNYFNLIGDTGIQMMRQTCSLHVNLDLGMEKEIAVNRILLSNLLTPFVTAIFANSPIIGGKLTGKKAYRSILWSQLDSKRMKNFDIYPSLIKNTSESLINSYTNFGLQAPLIFIRKFGCEVFNQNFNDWLNHPIRTYEPTIDDLKNHFSLLFPEVRWKGFLELRSADALPRKWQLAPAVFFTGLLYSDSMLEKALDKLLPLASRMEELKTMAVDGLDSDLLFNLAKELMVMAGEGFSGLSEKFQSASELEVFKTFFETYTSQRRVVADDWIELFSQNKSLIY